MPLPAPAPADRRRALEAAAARLASEFTGTFNTQTVERLLHSSEHELAATATVQTYVPLLAERFARQRLQALARTEGRVDDGRPVVLFLCVHNAGRSQMALGLLRELAGNRVIGWSGGSLPAGGLNGVVVEAMAERDIDISEEFPKPWTDEVVRAADVVVTMGCGEACPVLPGKRYEEWALGDPDGQELDQVRSVRDEIEQRVRRLLHELGVPPTS
ncbi:arsenate reductase ArsC [Nocardioides sp. 31GB23]|uniref:arsenate reductase ArsC n=1 Tax=Nocardioides sp. 31GB23 TaxID=3156065 RepID=UPI0032AFB205